MKQQFTVFDVIARAYEIGIEFTVVNGELKLDAPKGVITPKVLQVIKEYKSEIIYELTPLCHTCFEVEHKEEPAAQLHSDDFYYCARHYPMDSHVITSADASKAV